MKSNSLPRVEGSLHWSVYVYIHAMVSAVHVVLWYISAVVFDGPKSVGLQYDYG